MSSYHLIRSQLICADYEKEYPMVESGKGVFLYTSDGRRYIDVSGCTAVVTTLGHGNEEVAQVLSDQAKKLAVHPTHVFYNHELEDYLAALCDFSPEGFNHGWTICGGTEAVENSIKLAFQYHQAKGQTDRKKVVGRWGSYHGNSITALDVGGLKTRRDFYTPLMVDHYHVSPCFSYRRLEGTSIEEYEDSLVKEFADLVSEKGHEILAFVVEPIVGAALGAVGATPGYFKRIHEICRAHDILLIADEVMNCFGRTGKNYGIEHYGGHADILALAKGISAGYFPLGAVVAHDRVIEPIEASGHPFYSGQTYSCIPLGAAVGKAVLDQVEKLNLVENSAQVGGYLKKKFEEKLLPLDFVGDVRGEGLFIGVEFVKDKETKEPFDPDLNFSKRVQAKAMDHGLVTYACRGTVDFNKGDHMLFAPPLILTEEEADMIVDGTEKAVKEVYGEVG